MVQRKSIKRNTVIKKRISVFFFVCIVRIYKI